jgi:hypothetical protein
MRRAASIVLFVLGGWILSSEVLMAGIDFAPEVTDTGAQIAALAILALFALPFFVIGTWTSPGNRWAELGLTLMITAVVGAALALVVLMVLKDPSFRQYMPPDQPVPEVNLRPLPGVVNLLIISGFGYALWRWARGHALRGKPDLERIFGDD